MSEEKQERIENLLTHLVSMVGLLQTDQRELINSIHSVESRLNLIEVNLHSSEVKAEEKH